MENAEYYKQLVQELDKILKPLNFKKRGKRFRRILNNGIAQEVEIQTSRFDFSSFTVNIWIGLLPLPIGNNFWKKALATLKHLGNPDEDEMKSQYWYNFVNKDNSTIRNGRLILGTACYEDGTTSEISCLYLSVEEICENVCKRILTKAIPYFLSVQTLDEYLELILKTLDYEEFMGTYIGYDELLFYINVFGKKMSPYLQKRIKNRIDALKNFKGKMNTHEIELFNKMIEKEQKLYEELNR